MVLVTGNVRSAVGQLTGKLLSASHEASGWHSCWGKQKQAVGLILRSQVWWATAQLNLAERLEDCSIGQSAVA